MQPTLAFVPRKLYQHTDKALYDIAACAFGIALLAALAQVSIHLPFSPVPITGQTLGVAIVSLLWGAKRAVTVLVSYLTLGSIGLPILAGGASGLPIGPSAGYLIGMLAASYAMGSLADRGWTQTTLRTWLATMVGSAITFFFGLLWLSFFVPSRSLLIAGLLPFLPGDFIKTAITVAVVRRTCRQQENLK